MLDATNIAMAPMMFIAKNRTMPITRAKLPLLRVNVTRSTMPVRKREGLKVAAYVRSTVPRYGDTMSGAKT